jgi:hypothetical protein
MAHLPFPKAALRLSSLQLRLPWPGCPAVILQGACRASQGPPLASLATMHAVHEGMLTCHAHYA